MQQPVIIRKYPNRRLYDTSSRRYVNLSDLAEMVRQGVEIQVVDARSGEDVTRVVLTQIIADDAREQPAGLPLELLRELIRTSDRAGQEFLMWYLKSAYEAYQKVQETALSPVQMVKDFLGGARASSADDELERLRRRVEELEALLDERGTRRRRSSSTDGLSD